MSSLYSYGFYQPAESEWARDIVEAQNRVATSLRHVLEKDWLAGSRLIEGVALSAHTANDIAHGLGRNVRGWHIVADNAPRCSFSAYSSGQTVNTGSDDIVTMATESYDWGGHFSTSTHLFTAPVDGLYSFGGHARHGASASGGVVYLSLKSSGGSTLRAQGGMNDVIASQAGFVECTLNNIRLTAGATVGLFCGHAYGSTSITTTGGSGITYFCGGLINQLISGQGDSDHPGIDKFLRLYSTCARTVDLVVY